MPATHPAACLRARCHAPCREDLQQYSGPWPQHMFVGMGTAEFTGTRGAEVARAGAKFDKLLVSYCKELAALLEQQGLDSRRLAWQVGAAGKGRRGGGAATARW